MSQQPPPPPYGDSPYGGPPASPPGPPYGAPPGPYPSGSPGEPQAGWSNKAKFWIGVALAIPAILLSGLITGSGSAIVEGAGGDPGLGAAISGALALLLLAGFVAMLVVARTRWVALGMLAGTAVLLILAAGACVVLLVGLSNSYG